MTTSERAPKPGIINPCKGCQGWGWVNAGGGEEMRGCRPCHGSGEQPEPELASDEPVLVTFAGSGNFSD